MKPLWIKWYPVQWLHSTSRDEMTTEERSTFHDFVCLAAISPTPGKFKYKNNESLARQLNTNVEIIEKTQKICLEKNRIKIKKNREGYVCEIIKWHIYQSFKKEIDVNFKDEKMEEKLTLNDLDKIREDKIRSDKKRERDKDVTKRHAPVTVCDVSASASASPSASNNKKKYVIQFDFETRMWLGIVTDDLSSWEKAYPAVDIQNHLNRMKEWLLSNPEKRKQNYRRFITNWLSREQDKPTVYLRKGDRIGEQKQRIIQRAQERVIEIKKEEKDK